MSWGTPLKNNFSWSKSRDGVFKDCKRAYYLTHYGAWGGWEKSASPDLQELYVMKNLQTRPTLVGVIVHDVAERAVRALAAGGLLDEADALEAGLSRLKQELTLSQEGAYRRGVRFQWGGKRIKATGLQEDYYQEPTAGQDWETLEERVTQCIRTLYQSSAYRRLEADGPAIILSVEELEQFQVGDVPVWVKLDLAVRGHQDTVVIVDWKTGGSHVEEDIAFQLGIYGLHLEQTKGVTVERLRGFDVNLRDGSTRSHQITRDVLDNVTAYIQQSAAEMKSLLDDVEQNVASIDRFPQTDDLSRCAFCRYRRACQRETPP